MHNSDVSRRAFMKLTAEARAVLALPSLGEATVPSSSKMLGIQS